MRPLLAAFAAALSLLVVVGEAPAKTPYVNQRPTFRQGRDVMYTVLHTYAGNTEGRLTLGPCRRRAKLWIVCRARIDYKHMVAHYRFQVSRDATYYVMAIGITTSGR